MVNPINDATGVKSIDSDNHLSEIGPAIDDSTSIDTISISCTSKQLEALNLKSAVESATSGCDSTALFRLKASLRDIPEINEARVLYFKAELQSGNYQINNDKIARNILNCVEMA
jgi:negative regulator of flagellin synthesis FlgM